LLTQTQLAKIFGKDVHFISKFLKECGFKTKDNKPTKALISQKLAVFDKTWLYDESLITSLENFGLSRLRKYKIKNETADKTRAYCDGSRGSYAAVLIESGSKHYTAGVSDDLLDNNRAELFAIKAAIELANSNVIIYSDSKYAIAALKKPHIQEKNLDILADIAIIARQKQIEYTLVWIKGHVGIIHHEEADELCTFVKQLKL
jgi:ribonuclease HI